MFNDVISLVWMAILPHLFHVLAMFNMGCIPLGELSVVYPFVSSCTFITKIDPVIITHIQCSSDEVENLDLDALDIHQGWLGWCSYLLYRSLACLFNQSLQDGIFPSSLINPAKLSLF